MSLLFDAMLAWAGMPRWVWAALLMAAFVGVSVITMLLAGYPVRRAPPPVAAPDADQSPRADA